MADTPQVCMVFRCILQSIGTPQHDRYRAMDRHSPHPSRRQRFDTGPRCSRRRKHILRLDSCRAGHTLRQSTGHESHTLGHYTPHRTRKPLLGKFRVPRRWGQHTLHLEHDRLVPRDMLSKP